MFIDTLRKKCFAPEERDIPFARCFAATERRTCWVAGYKHLVPLGPKTTAVKTSAFLVRERQETGQ
jgi:hypothetical protein